MDPLPTDLHAARPGLSRRLSKMGGLRLMENTGDLRQVRPCDVGRRLRLGGRHLIGTTVGRSRVLLGSGDAAGAIFQDRPGRPSTDARMAQALISSQSECEVPLLIRKAPSIVMAYGKLLKTHPLGILDTKFLPLPKPHMKTMLKLSYKRALTEGERRVIEQFYIGLSSFQRGIGDTPIDLDKPASTSRLQTAAHGSLMRQIAEESRALLEEFKEFKQSLLERSR